MSGSQFDHRRQRALDLRLSGQCTKAEYDEMLAEIDRLQAANSPKPHPVYIPDLADREKGTVAGFPIPPALKSGALLDKYELKSSKRGGMGEVWKAWDAKADRWVAIKFLPPELRGNAEEIARIRRQFGLVKKLSHPHICAPFDLNEHPVWGWYEVMDWIEGKTLKELLDEAGGKLPLERVIELLGPAASALDYAHGESVLHRDIKPQNIMFGQRTGDKDAKVWGIDFGLAAEVRGSLSRVSKRIDSLSGTPQYLAPELWNEAPESAKSDQYALAITAYELLAGGPPFKSDNIPILMARVQTAEVPAINGLLAGAMVVLQRELAKQPGERFDRCSVFVRELANRSNSSALQSPLHLWPPSSTRPVVTFLEEVGQPSRSEAFQPAVPERYESMRPKSGQLIPTTGSFSQNSEEELSGDSDTDEVALRNRVIAFPNDQLLRRRYLAVRSEFGKALDEVDSRDRRGVKYWAACLSESMVVIFFVSIFYFFIFVLMDALLGYVFHDYGQSAAKVITVVFFGISIVSTPWAAIEILKDNRKVLSELAGPAPLSYMGLTPPREYAKRLGVEQMRDR